MMPERPDDQSPHAVSARIYSWLAGQFSESDPYSFWSLLASWAGAWVVVACVGAYLYSPHGDAFIRTAGIVIIAVFATMTGVFLGVIEAAAKIARLLRNAAERKDGGSFALYGIDRVLLFTVIGHALFGGIVVGPSVVALVLRFGR